MDRQYSALNPHFFDGKLFTEELLRDTSTLKDGYVLGLIILLTTGLEKVEMQYW